METVSADVRLRDAEISNLTKIIEDMKKEIEGFSVAIESYNMQLTLC